MRKAASQRTRVLISVFVLIFIFLVTVSNVQSYSIDPNKSVSPDQDPSDAITGSIRLEGNEAVGTVVNSGTDNVKVGLASYTQVDEDIENQVLFASVESDLGAGETKELRIAVPCWAQVDLFRIFPERFGQNAGVITSFKGNVRYGERLVSAVHTVNECNGGASATPTASPSATPVATASPAPTEALVVISTPTNPPSDNLGCSVKDCSGNVVAAAPVVAGVSTDRLLPATGSEGLVNVLIVGLGIMSVGFGMRRLAWVLEQ